MGAYKITSRQIIGMILNGLADAAGADWIGQTSMYFPDSDQASEEYAWLALPPAMREWIGGRNAKGLREESYTIKNKKFEATIRILCDWIRRDKTGQIMQRIAQLAERGNSHWAKLLSALIIAGESTLCYDGNYFFATDHSEGSSGSQSNLVSVDISALPCNQHGSTTSPSSEELEQVVFAGIQAILGYKDAEGEPMNDGASSFLVMMPTTFLKPGASATSSPVLNNGTTNTLISVPGLTIRPQFNPRLTWTTDLLVLRTDGVEKAFIRQEEQGVQVSAKAEGSEFEHDNDQHEYGIMAIRNVGYGLWQQACKVKLT